MGFALAAVVLTSALRAQKTSVPPEPERNADSSARVAATDSIYSFDGFVQFGNGRPAKQALVVLVPAASNPLPRRSTVTDEDGRFHFDSLSGRYLVRVDVPNAQSAIRRLTADRNVAGRIVLEESRPAPERSPTQTIWTIVFLVLYLLTIATTRWHHIARSLNEMIMGELNALEVRLDTEVDNSNGVAIQKLRGLITSLREGMKPKWKLWLPELIFWSRGRENASWVALHEVERQLAAYLAPPEQIDAYLRWAAPELRALNTPSALAIADAVALSLQAKPTDPGANATMRKALLGRAIAIINADRDDTFSRLMEWQNKASWLTIIALGIIGFLTAGIGNAILFLAGGAGGYLSRVMRALQRDDIPLDYGASWTTLFLSPLFGALAGWFGIALITLLARPDLQLLGEAFRLVRWDEPSGTATFSIAFVLGFSERFFDAIVGALDKNAQRDQSARDAGRRTVTPIASPGTDSDAAAASEKKLAKAPHIDSVTVRPPTGTPTELVVTGSGFESNSTATINGAARRTTFNSENEIIVTLTDDDTKLLQENGQLKVRVTANEAQSNEFER